MLLARTLPVGLPFACALLLLLTSCTSTQSTRHRPEPDDTLPHTAPVDTADETPPSPARAPSEPTPPDEPPAPAAVDPIAVPVIARLATILMADVDSITVVSVTPGSWPDTCLGLAANGEICGMMITPGHTVTLATGTDVYVFRTDATADQIRVASAPEPRTGEPLVTWRDSRSFNMMVVGTQRVAIGRRGRPLIAAPLAVPVRAAELQSFLSRFAAFQAQTPAGEIALLGVGATRATETDQRMIAEWARHVSFEAREGGEVLEVDAALRWTRRGGTAGLCDMIEVTRTGIAIASNCRDEEPATIAHVPLSLEELATLYRWLDRLETFAFTANTDGSVADGVTTQLEFRGTGVDEASESERTAMQAWLDAIALRLRDAALR